MAFFENITRLQATLILPVFVAAYSRLFEQQKAQAVAETKMSESDEGYNNAIDDRISALCTEWMADNDDLARGHFIARYGAGTFVRLSAGPIRAGSDAILVSQLTGMWTAFESLAGDLWTAAINAHPHGLAELNGGRGRIRKAAKAKGDDSAQDETDHRETQEAEGSVLRADIVRLSRGTYDLRDKMGDLLRESFSFIKLNGIRAAYSCAFSERADKIDKVLADKALDALNAVRNVFVHSAGTIDDAYIDQSKGLPLAPQGQKGKQIKVDGKIVRALVQPVYEVSAELIKAVDSWIVGVQAIKKARDRAKTE